jgi:TonB-dependent receptor
MDRSLPSIARRLLTIALLLPAALAAQTPTTGTIRGRVTDDLDRPLAGAVVEVEGTSTRALSDRDGWFRLPAPAGQRTVTVRYLGYAPGTIDVSVQGQREAFASVQLAETAIPIEGILVTGQVAGQAAALSQQRVASRITTVIDNELVGRLPDPNMAEALSRVPGIAIDRDQGEGRFVQIRGTPPKFTSLSINGERVPTANSSNRAVQMDVVPSDQAAVIEVTKTLTPDLDADAIGGNVNIVTRAARSGVRTFDVTYAQGQNVLNEKPVQNAVVNLGQRFGPREQLGVMVGGVWYRNQRASQNFEGTWCVQSNDCGPTGSASQSSLDAPNLWELRDYPQVDRERKGVNGSVDYRFDDHNRVSLRGSYSQFSDDEIRFRTRFGFRAGSGSRWTMVTPDSGVVTGARIDRDIRMRKIISGVEMMQLAGTHGLPDGSEFDWAAALTRAHEDRPNSRTLSFRQTGATLAYNFADEDRPRATVVNGSFDDPTRFPFNSFTGDVQHVRDNDQSLRLSYRRPLSTSDVAVTVKLGGAARMKSRTNELLNFTSTAALGSNTLGATGATLFSTLVGGSGGRTSFDSYYQLGRHVQADAAADFVAANRSAFTINQVSSTTTTAGGTFTVDEDVYAGYLMATIDAGRFHLIPGVRYEATRNHNTANRLDITATAVQVTPLENSSSYGDVFPSVTANLEVTDLTNLRAAVTTAIIRPDFGDLVPRVRVAAGDNTAQIGNADLRPTRALNLDFMVEHFLAQVGVVSAGVFYKDLTDLIVPQARAPRAGELFGAEVTQVLQPINGNKGKVYGLELAWQQNLTFLPGLLRGLGLNANATFARSETTYPGRGDKKYPIYQQTGTAGNLGVFYDLGRVSLRTGVNYAGEFISLVAPVEAADQRRRPRLQVDAAGTLRLMQNAHLFLEGINLSDTPYRSMVGDKPTRGGGGEDASYEFYKPWFLVGLRVQP